MLCLVRTTDQRVTITAPTGEQIEVCLVESKYGRARIGIEAPRGWKILRNELIEDSECDRVPQLAGLRCE